MHVARYILHYRCRGTWHPPLSGRRVLFREIEARSRGGLEETRQPTQHEKTETQRINRGVKTGKEEGSVGWGSVP
eukprot:2773395-Rhodomonas_salina.1